MSSDGNDDVLIPSTFIEGDVGRMLIDLIDEGKQVKVLLTWATEDLINQLNNGESKGPTPPTPIGPTKAPSVMEHQPSKPTEQDFREESANKVSTSDSGQGLPTEEEEDVTDGCLASGGLFDSGREDEQQEHVESSVDDVHR